MKNRSKQFSRTRLIIGKFFSSKNGKGDGVFSLIGGIFLKFNYHDNTIATYTIVLFILLTMFTVICRADVSRSWRRTDETGRLVVNAFLMKMFVVNQIEFFVAALLRLDNIYIR